MLKLARFVRRGPLFATAAAVTVLAVSLAIPGAAAGAVKAPDTMLPAAVSTLLYGGGPPSTAISVPAGAAVTDIATLSGPNTAIVDGTVTYQVYSDSSCTVPVSDATSTVTVLGPSVPASDPVTLTTAGTYYWQASYSGDVNNLPAASLCGIGGEVETVTAAATTVATSLSGGGQSGTSISVPGGTAVTDTATLSGTNADTATGTVTYEVYPDALCIGTPVSDTTVTITGVHTVPTSDSVTLPTAGTYYWQATYNGDANNLTSTSACGAEVETVTPASTSLGTALSGGDQSGTSISVPAGTTVADAATLTGTNAATATGTITYNVYSDSACTTSENAGAAEDITTPGTIPASLPVTFDTAGTYYWQASYSGDDNNLASVSACNTEVVTVTAASTSVTTMLSENSVTAGTPVTDTATLSGAVADAATGTIIYDVYSDPACTDRVSSGAPLTITTPGTVPASDPVTFDTAGTYYWQASYSGDDNNLSSTSTCGAEVETVTPADTGTATSLSGGGQSGLSISVPAGTAVTDTATLSGTDAGAATGTVTYDVYSDSGCTTMVSTGTPLTITTPGTVPASDPVTLATAGTYYWQATYSGDDNNLTSTSTCGTEVETVTPAAPTSTALRTQLSGSEDYWLGDVTIVSPGTAVTDSATLSGANAAEATGTVTYTVYSAAFSDRFPYWQSQWEPVASGGTVTVTAGSVPDSDAVTLPPGIYYWQASYSGDAYNAPSVSQPGSEVEYVIFTPRYRFG
jgi:hypothetical protein